MNSFIHQVGSVEREVIHGSLDGLDTMITDKDTVVLSIVDQCRMWEIPLAIGAYRSAMAYDPAMTVEAMQTALPVNVKITLDLNGDIESLSAEY